MKNRKNLRMRIVSMMLAFVMIFSFTFNDVSMIRVNASEMGDVSSENQEGSSENGTSEDGKTKDGISEDGKTEDGAPEDGKAEDGAPEDGKAEDGVPEDGKTEDGEPEDGKTEDGAPEDEENEDDSSEEDGEVEKAPEFLYAFNRIEFQALKAWNVLSSDNDEKVEYDTNTCKDGVIVTAKNKQMKKTTFKIEKEIDFEDQEPNRILINAVGKRATKTKINIFVDDEETPSIVGSVVAQKKEDDWTRQKALNVDISELHLTGKHTIRFTIDDATTMDDKKTTVLLRSIAFVKDNIPVVNLNIDESFVPIVEMNGDTNHDTECYGDISISVPEEYVNEYESKSGETYKGGTYKLDYIRGRGNSTWWADKKPYKIKLDEEANLFKMGSNKHWVLLANYYDNSLVRNRMTYWLGRELGMEYTPECISVDVYMNGEYLGNYLLCEQIRVGEERVEINDMEKEFKDKPMTEEDNITGGYLLGMSPYGDEKGYGFETEKGNQFYVESPESSYSTSLGQRLFGYGEEYGYALGNAMASAEGEDVVGSEVNNKDEYSEENGGVKVPEDEEPLVEDESPYALANAYISNYVQQVEDAIFSPDFSYVDDEGNKHHYSELMDVDSAVAYYWMQEFSLNGDSYLTPSTYLYKKKDGKLFWGPLWDFDYVAWASTEYEDYDESDRSYAGWEMQRVWFERLMEDKDFSEKVKAYWKEKLEPAMKKVTEDGGLLDRYEQELTLSATNNFDKWGYTNFSWDYYSEESGGLYGEDHCYADEIARLKSWIEHRSKWVDENLEDISPTPVSVTYMLDGKEYDSHEIFTNRQANYMPENPEQDEYVFMGWYYNMAVVDEETEEVKFEETKYNETTFISAHDVIDGKLVVTGKWIAKKDIKPVDGIHFQQKNYYSWVVNYAGETYTEDFKIAYGLMPTDAFTLVEWSSSDEKIATVADGVVTPKAIGKVTITATTYDGKTATANVEIMDGRYTGTEYDKFTLQDYEISEKNVSLNVNESVALSVTTTPEVFLFPESSLDIIWESMNPSVATIENGVITAKAPGVTCILVRGYTEEDVKFKACIVTVNGPKDDKDKDQTKPGTSLKPNGSNGSNVSNSSNSSSNNSSTTTTKTDTVKKNTKFVKDNLKFKVTKVSATSNEVAVTGIKKSKKAVVIPGAVVYEGKTFKVTSIAKKAFAKDKKLEKVTVGKNVTKIESKAFYSCKKCKSVVIKSTKLKKVGSQAFKKTAKKVTVTIPKKKYSSYKKMFKGLNMKKK